jgi:hypothetical protein
VRVPAVVVPSILLLAGTLYFLARARENAGRLAESQFDRSAHSADSVADEHDRELVRSLIEAKDLSEEQANSLVRAAGRRYMRRKLAYNEARQSGKASTGELDVLRVNLEAARRVCDVAESVERHTRELTLMARADFEMESQISTLAPSMLGLVERYNGSSTFTATDLRAMEQAFFKQFGRILPVSTRGDSAVHRALGFDHRGRFDLAVSPSQPEGLWARRYLIGKNFSFFAFRTAVPGMATGAHIHIGPGSAHRAPQKATSIKPSS